MPFVVASEGLISTLATFADLLDYDSSLYLEVPEHLFNSPPAVARLGRRHAWQIPLLQFFRHFPPFPFFWLTDAVFTSIPFGVHQFTGLLISYHAQLAVWIFGIHKGLSRCDAIPVIVHVDYIASFVLYQTSSDPSAYPYCYSRRHFRNFPFFRMSGV
jgi:hypothetical protein